MRKGAREGRLFLMRFAVFLAFPVNRYGHQSKPTKYRWMQVASRMSRSPSRLKSEA